MLQTLLRLSGYYSVLVLDCPEWFDWHEFKLNVTATEQPSRSPWAPVNINLFYLFTVNKISADFHDAKFIARTFVVSTADGEDWEYCIYSINHLRCLFNFGPLI